jgi:hypothetical protein
MRVALIELIHAVPCDGIDKIMIRTVDEMALPDEQSIFESLGRERFGFGERQGLSGYD